MKVPILHPCQHLFSVFSLFYQSPNRCTMVTKTLVLTYISLMTSEVDLFMCYWLFVYLLQKMANQILSSSWVFIVVGGGFLNICFTSS